MKELIRQVGIVLNSRPYKDTSEIIKILNDKGINSFIVRGVNKQDSKTRKFVQYPLVLDFYSTTSNIGTITEASVANSYSNIHSDENKYLHCLIIIEKLLQFEGEIQDKNLLYNFVNSLFNLMETTKHPEGVSLIFEIKLLYLLGLGFSLRQCPICSKDVEFGLFSIKNGGMLCKNCSYKYYTNLDIDESKELRKIYVTKIEKVNEELLDEYSKYPNINNVIDEYYAYHLEFSSKVKNTLKKIIKKEIKHE